MTTIANPSPIERLWPAGSASQKAVRAVALVLLGNLLLVAAAKTQVPFWPVPMTMQTLAVVLIGATGGARLGFATLFAYLAQGAAGLPVFAGTPERGIGLAYMVGPTGGYLLGFLLAATLIGWLVQRGVARTLPRIALCVLAAHATVHVFGLAWLSRFVGLEGAVANGFVPFMPADVLKMAIAVAAIAALQRPVGKR